MPSQISDLLSAATDAAKEWGLPCVAADGDCLGVSKRFSEHLGGERVMVYGWVNVEAKLLGFAHVATRVGSVIVDATVTQFDRNLPMPWVVNDTDYCVALAEALGLDAVTLAPAPAEHATRR